MLYKPFLLFVLSYLLLSLNACTQMSDQKVLELLKDKYDKDFTILESRYSPETGLNYIKAVSKESPEIQFNVEYDPSSNEMTSFYEEYLWRNQAKTYYSESLEKKYQKFALNVDVYPEKVPEPKAIPHFEDILKNSSGELKLSFQIHLFDDLEDSNQKKILKPIKNLIDEVLENNVKDGAIVIRFYDEAYFKKKSLDEYSFGFTTPDMEDFETIESDKFRGQILLTFSSESKGPSTKDLYSYYTKNRYSFEYHQL